MEHIRIQDAPRVHLNEGGAELYLWAAVLSQAHLDYWHGKPADQVSARRWLCERDGSFANLVCVLFDIDPDKARELIFTRPAKKRSFNGFAWAEMKRLARATEAGEVSVGLRPQKHARVPQRVAAEG